ncbi:unnamed protein product, partial [marine sediment metagenome]
GQLREAKADLREVAVYCERYGCEVLAPAVQGMLGVVSISKGNFKKGIEHDLLPFMHILNANTLQYIIHGKYHSFAMRTDYF